MAQGFTTGWENALNAARAALNIHARTIEIRKELAGRIKDEIYSFDRGLMNFKNVKEEVRVYSLVRPG